MITLPSGGEQPFKWGDTFIVDSDPRKRYIAALRAADAKDHAPLFALLDVV
jgi:hypothetical protein